MKGRYTVEKRMMLEGSFDGERMDLALNDIVVDKRRGYSSHTFLIFM